MALLFAPAQAVREYGKNRARKVADVFAQVHTRLTSLPTVSPLNSPMLEGIEEYEALKQVAEEIKEKTKKYRDNLTALKLLLADWGWDDRVSELYRQVFTAAHIVHHDLSDGQIKEDLARRHTYTLPPGYKDSGKFDEGVGDVIIWHSLLKLSKDTKRHVIFVCNEEKADWLIRSNKETLMPRPELTHEFYQARGKYFAMMSWPRFLKAMHAAPGTVREAERAQEETLRLFSPIEKRVTELLEIISGILEEFRAEWAGDLEDTSYGGPPYIMNDDLENLISSFHTAVVDYDRLIAKSQGVYYLKELDSILGGILDDNKTLHFIEVRQKHSGDLERARLIGRCKQFDYTYCQYLVWLSVASSGIPSI